MRLVAMADLHLGYRQYDRVTPEGQNVREADVARTFSRAIDQTIALAPELVVFGGDIFHSVRPSNAATVHAFREFQRLQAALAGVTVVITAGNHDLPRTTDSRCMLDLFRSIGVLVADRKAESWDFPERDLAIAAVPDTGARQAIPRAPARKYTVLVMHGDVAGVIPHNVLELTTEILPEELDQGDWDYVALGHWHVHRQVAQRAFYAGSIDYTSSNPWGELREEAQHGLAGKGIVEFDLDTSTLTFHPLAPARPLFDLSRLSAHGLTAAEVSAAIVAAAEALGPALEGAIVRQVVTDIPASVSRELDHKAIKALRAKALAYQLDFRRPEAITLGSRLMANARTPRGLADLLFDALTARELAGDIDRDTFIKQGLAYLAETDPDAAALSAAASDAQASTPVRTEGKEAA